MKRIGLLFILFVLFLAGFATEAAAQLPVPENLKAEISSGELQKGVKLTWLYPAKILVKFAVYRKEGLIADTGSFRKLERATMMPYYFDQNVLNGKKYTYYAVAIGPDGKESLPSNKAEITVAFTELQRGFISGTLKADGTNAAVKRGKVSFIPTAPAAGIYSLSVSTDTLGAFNAKLAPGEYYVFAGGEKFIPEFYENARTLADAKKVQVAAGATNTIAISLAPLAPPVYYTIKGNVKSAAGSAIKARIQVFRLNSERYQKEVCNIVYAGTDELGNYSVRVLSGDTVAVFAEPGTKEFLPQYYNKKKTLQEADKLVVTGDLADINFVLETRPVLNNGISGAVTDTLGAGVISSVVAFRVSDSKYGKAGVLTDSTGKYAISNLAPGKYLLQVIPRPGYAPTYYRKDGKFTLDRSAADTLTVTETTLLKDVNFTVKKIFRTKGISTIAGWIKDRTGAGLNGAIIYILGENGDMASYGISNSSGQFMAEGLNAGNYSIKADLFEYKESGAEYVTVGTDGASSVVNMVLEPSGTTAVRGPGEAVPQAYSLKQNYPNPFNPSTTISYTIPQSGFVSLKVYNIIGKEVATIVNEEKAAGSYSVRFNAAGIPSGIYFYTLTAGSYIETKKLTLLR